MGESDLYEKGTDTMERHNQYEVLKSGWLRSATMEDQRWNAMHFQAVVCWGGDVV